MPDTQQVRHLSMGNFAYRERLKALIHNELSPTTRDNRARVAKGRKRTCQGIPRQEGDGGGEQAVFWFYVWGQGFFISSGTTGSHHMFAK